MRRVKQGQFFWSFRGASLGISLGTGVSAGLPTAKNTGWGKPRKRNFADYIIGTVTGWTPIPATLIHVLEPVVIFSGGPPSRFTKGHVAASEKGDGCGTVATPAIA
jgi:hypothetical protein